MRRRIETQGSVHVLRSCDYLPTNIHEKKDWNVSCRPYFRATTNPYQPISMRRRIETLQEPGRVASPDGLTNQYPWEEGLKRGFAYGAQRPSCSLPTNIHEKKDWNFLFLLSFPLLPRLTNQYPWEEGLKHRIHLLVNQGLFSYQPISMRRRIETLRTVFVGYVAPYAYQPISMRRRIETSIVQMWSRTQI